MCGCVLFFGEGVRIAKNGGCAPQKAIGQDLLESVETRLMRIYDQE